MDGLRRAIAYYEDLLAHERRRFWASSRKRCARDLKKFGDKRRTEISRVEKDPDVEDLIADEDMVVTITHTGYVKRIPVAAYRAQKRGGKACPGVNLKEDDVIDEMFIASTHRRAVLLEQGQGLSPEGARAAGWVRRARGTAIVNLFALRVRAKIASVISCREFPADEYLMFATKRQVKKTVMSAYDRSRRDGLIAINLRDDDALLNVRRVREGDKITWPPPRARRSCSPRSRCAPPAAIPAGVRGGMKDGGAFWAWKSLTATVICSSSPSAATANARRLRTTRSRIAAAGVSPSK